MTLADEIAHIVTRLNALEGATGNPAAQCTAQAPHDTLSYDRRRYVCRCGKIYMKDGFGGLRDA